MRNPTTRHALRALLGGVVGLGLGSTALAQGGAASDETRARFEAGFRAGIADERRRQGPGAGWNEAAQGQAMRRLERARILLREALVALQEAPLTESRRRAIAQAREAAREALIHTQNAVTWMPRGGSGSSHGATPRRMPPGALEHGWGERASGGPRG